MKQVSQKYFQSSQIYSRDEKHMTFHMSFSNPHADWNKERGRLIPGRLADRIPNRGGGRGRGKGKRKTKPKKTFLDRKEKPFSIAHMKTTFTNTIVTVTDQSGNALLWESAGKMKLKGGKKKTPYAARQITLKACKRAYLRGVRNLEIVIRGSNYTRKSALRGAAKSGVGFVGVKVFNLLPHNGCRPPKKRRKRRRDEYT